MNHVYRLLWSEAAACFVAVAETAGARGKRRGGRRSRRRGGMGVALALLMVAPAWAEPQGGQVQAGQGSISQSGPTTTITQASARLAINWQGFSVGANETVTFVQPGPGAVALNRVIGTEGSRILGNINANGQVFLLNPNGVLFGKTAQVNVGGLLASTLSISDADFMAGRLRLNRPAAEGAAITNEGTLRAADGGYVALVAPSVVNTGSIVAQLGTVALAAGNKVTLDFAGDGLLKLVVDQGAVAALAANGGLIRADGGRVLLTAQAADALATATVNNTGVIEARTLQNRSGRILLMGDMAAGTTNVGGTLDASAPDSGDGGFVETSAAQVAVAADARVTTRAQSGRFGTWLVDPTDFTVSAGNAPLTGSGIGAATLSANLATTNVALQTATGGAQPGDLTVASPVSWSGNTSLTLEAARDINLNAPVTSTGIGAALSLTSGRNINVNAPVSLAGEDAGMNMTFGGDYLIRAPITFSGAYPYLNINSQAYGLVKSMADVLAINTDLGGRYALAVDLSAGSYSDSLIAPSGGSEFTGVFAGLGHTISNLRVNGPRFIQETGLFGQTRGAVLRDFGLVGGSIAGTYDVGALVGIATTTTIRGVYSTATVTGLRGRTGGLVGFAHFTTIDSSYVTGAVNGDGNAGGLVGESTYSSIRGSFASGDVSGRTTGGLVGQMNEGSSLTDSYATGNVVGSVAAGGLIGDSFFATVNRTFSTGAVSGGPTNTGGLIGNDAGLSTVTNSFWNTDVVGGSGQATSEGGTGKTGAELRQLATFTAAGWDIDAQAGTGRTWRIYEGNTTPLVRSFMKPAALLPDYDGSQTVLANIGSFSMPAGFDSSQLLGSDNSLTITSSGVAGNYLATAGRGLYSTQLGYDISSSRVFSTPGSAAGDIVLDRPINWTDGTLNISAPGTIRVSAPIFGFGNSTFNLEQGTWNALAFNGSTGIEVFRVKDFRIGGGTFLGGKGGDGSAASPYLLHDIYALQGMASSGLLGRAFKLVGPIDASRTANWNAGAGFVPIGTAATPFTGSFDGQGQAIGNLTVNRPTAPDVGLFGGTAGSSVIRNAVLQNASVAGGAHVGALVGWNQGSITLSRASGSVAGTNDVGGLVGVSSGGFASQGVNGAIADSSADVAVTGSTRVGGLVGLNNGGPVDRSHASGAVQGSQAVGGLLGEHSFALLRDSYATGAVTATGSDGYAGGLVGILNGGNVSTSFATGQVNGVSRAGGLVADSDSGVILNSYATGNVHAGAAGGFAGGLVGANNRTVRTSFATGGVTGGAGAVLGGLVGSNTGAGAVTGGVWNTDSVASGGTGQSTSAGSLAADGKTGAQMRQLATFTAAAWDIDDAGATGKAWRIYGGQTLPLLRGFMTPLDLGGSPVTRTYNGVAQTGALPAGANASLLTGTPASGRNAGTYTSSYSSTQLGYDILGAATLTIARAPLALTTGSVSRTYDGTTAANGALLVTGGTQLFGTDTAGGGNFQFADKNAGTGKIVTVSGATINDGNGGGNYAVSYVGNSGSTISRANLSVTATGADRIYDGTTAASVSYADNRIPGDQLTVTGTAAFPDRNAGAGKPVTVTGVVLTGADAMNYNANATATTAASITPAPLAVAADNLGRLAGAPDPAFTFGTSGLVGGDTASTALTGVLARRPGEVPGPYGISQGSLAAVNGNYAIAFTPGTLEIQAVAVPPPSPPPPAGPGTAPVPPPAPTPPVAPAPAPSPARTPAPGTVVLPTPGGGPGMVVTLPTLPLPTPDIGRPGFASGPDAAMGAGAVAAAGASPGGGGAASPSAPGQNPGGVTGQAIDGPGAPPNPQAGPGPGVATARPPAPDPDDDSLPRAGEAGPLALTIVDGGLRMPRP